MRTRLVYCYMVLTLLTAMLSSSGCGRLTGGRCVARVNGEPVSRAQLASVLEAWYGPRALDELIDQRLVNQAARQAGVIITEEQIDASLASYRQSFSDQAAFEQAVARQGTTLARLRAAQRMRLEAEATVRSGIQITSEDLNQYRRASQLLVLPKTDPQTRQVDWDGALAQLQAIEVQIRGGLPFDQAVAKYSQDGVTREQGGDLGWRTREEYVYELQGPLFDEMQPGQVSAPIRSSAGYHLVRLEEVASQATGPQREQLTEELLRRRVDRELGPWMQRLREGATIQRMP